MPNACNSTLQATAVYLVTQQTEVENNHSKKKEMLTIVDIYTNVPDPNLEKFEVEIEESSNAGWQVGHNNPTGVLQEVLLLPSNLLVDKPFEDLLPGLLLFHCCTRMLWYGLYTTFKH